jgi:predicted oxidoreductase
MMGRRVLVLSGGLGEKEKTARKIWPMDIRVSIEVVRADIY